LIEDDVPLYVDYIKILKQALKKTVSELKKMADLDRAKHKRLSNMVIRFKTKKKGDDNVFRGVLKGKIENLTDSIERTEKAILETERAAELLEGYLFLTDEAPSEVSPFIKEYTL